MLRVGEGEHVGRVVLAAIGAIQRAALFLVDESDGQGGIGEQRRAHPFADLLGGRHAGALAHAIAVLDIELDVRRRGRGAGGGHKWRSRHGDRYGVVVVRAHQQAGLLAGVGVFGQQGHHAVGGLGQVHGQAAPIGQLHAQRVRGALARAAVGIEQDEAGGGRLLGQDQASLCWAWNSS
ncbi:hypothetical protein D3C86_1561040 [compost metagenome]